MWDKSFIRNCMKSTLFERSEDMAGLWEYVQNVRYPTL
jgi:hypothetical protein